MSMTTIKIPTTQVGAIHDSLTAARLALDGLLAPAGRDSARSAEEDAALLRRREEVVELIDQLDATVSEGAGWQEVTGSRPALWDAAYDAVCAAAEGVADECNDYWRGELPAFELRTRIADLGARFDLLDGLGPPPADLASRAR